MNKLTLVIIFVLFSISANAFGLIDSAVSYTRINMHSIDSSKVLKDFFKDSSNIIKIYSKHPNISSKYDNYLRSLKVLDSNVNSDEFEFDMLIIISNENQLDTIFVGLTSILYKGTTYLFNSEFYLNFSSIIPRFVFEDFLFFEIWRRD